MQILSLSDLNSHLSQYCKLHNTKSIWLFQRVFVKFRYCTFFSEIENPIFVSVTCNIALDNYWLSNNHVFIIFSVSWQLFYVLKQYIRILYYLNSQRIIKIFTFHPDGSMNAFYVKCGSVNLFCTLVLTCISQQPLDGLSCGFWHSCSPQDEL